MRRFYLSTILSLLVSSLLWFAAKEWNVSFLFDNPLTSLVQLSALLGATTFFQTFVFSSRLPFFESALPLDQAHRIHRVLGSISAAGIILHVTSLLLTTAPFSYGLTLYLTPGRNISYNAGIFAFYLFLLLIISTLYLKLPYHIWNSIHQATSFVIVFATIHIFTISSDISEFLPLRFWFMFIASAGIFAWLYRLFIYPLTAFRHHYIVTDVHTQQDITTITLTTVKNPLRATPGQFAFFQFEDKTLGQEIHPFTLLENYEKTLRIAVKASGDFTKKLANLSTSSRVSVAGPHGNFGTEMLTASKALFMVAGGIGITPFYHVLTIQQKKALPAGSRLLHITTKRDDQLRPVLEKATTQLQLPYTYHSTEESGKFSLTHYFSSFQAKELHQYLYFLCGPQSLIHETKNILLKSGVPASQIHYEEFAFNDSLISGKFRLHHVISPTLLALLAVILWLFALKQ